MSRNDTLLEFIWSAGLSTIATDWREGDLQIPSNQYLTDTLFYRPPKGIKGKFDFDKILKVESRKNAANDSTNPSRLKLLLIKHMTTVVRIDD